MLQISRTKNASKLTSEAAQHTKMIVT